MHLVPRAKKKSMYAVGLLAVLITGATYTFFTLEHRAQQRFFSVHECPAGNSSFVTVLPGGLLGNAIFEYLSTWSLARDKGAVPVVPAEILDQISIAFRSFEIPTLEDVANDCGFDFLTKVKQFLIDFKF